MVWEMRERRGSVVGSSAVGHDLLLLLRILLRLRLLLLLLGTAAQQQPPSKEAPLPL